MGFSCVAVSSTAEGHPNPRAHPAVQVLGCMRIAGGAGGRVYTVLSGAFIAQFGLFRIVIANAYFGYLVLTVLRLAQHPWWAWAGERCRWLRRNRKWHSGCLASSGRRLSSSARLQVLPSLVP